MNPLRICLLFLLVVFISVRAGAQIKISDRFAGAKAKKKRMTARADAKKPKPPHWIFGIGWNVVDDNSKPFKRLLDIRHSWNIRPYPTQLFVERGRGNKMSYGGVFNFNIYKPGKIINGKDNGGSFLFFSWDAYAKYHLGRILPLKDWADVYIPMGVGYTLRFAPPNRSTFMLDLGLGANFWVKDWWGINVQSWAKFGLRSPIIRTSSNYLQHSIGLVFKFTKHDHKKFPFIHARYPWVHRKRPGMEKS